MEKTLAIVTVATEHYQYALKAHARAIQQNVALAGVNGGHFIIVTDEKPITAILAHYRALLGDSWEVHHIALPLVEAKENYKRDAQLVIAALFAAAFDKARALNVDYVWTVESDVLPEPNNLRSMFDMLAFDGGFYGVAFCPYISQGGGGVMGGRGSELHQIAPNIHDDELDIPDDLAKRRKDHEEKLKALKKGEQPGKDWHEENGKIHEEIRKCPPKDGNVFALNAKGWRQRGWLEWAFPEVGKGGVLPSDWMPMGNNLFGKTALKCMDFTGYDGGGTQDLFIAFRKLKPNGINLCVIPHCLSHHVVRRKDADGNPIYKLLYMYHEPGGEFIGHIRHRELPWFDN